MKRKANHANPIYQSIYTELENRIKSGDISRLSAIVIAREYGVNRNTADKIICLLETNGIVRRIPRKGTFPVRDTIRKIDSINIIYGFDDFSQQFINSYPYVNAKIIEAIFRAPAAKQCNVNLLFMDPSWPEELKLEKMTSLGVRAGFVVLPQQNLEIIRILEKEKLPYVTFAPSQSDFNYVSYDNYGASCRVFRHMIHNLGRKHILFLGSGSSPASNLWGEARFRAYCDVLKENDIPLDKQYVIFNRGNSSPGAAIEKALRIHPEVDAIFASSFIPGQILIQKLREMKVKIPNQIAVAIFHDLPEFSENSPSFTAVRAPYEKIGQQIVTEVLNMLNFGYRNDIRISLNAELILRESC